MATITIESGCNFKSVHMQTGMAGSSKFRLSEEEVLALLEDEQDKEGCPDEVFCPGSDEELSFLGEEEDMDQLQLAKIIDTFEVSKYILQKMHFLTEMRKNRPS